MEVKGDKKLESSRIDRSETPRSREDDPTSEIAILKKLVELATTINATTDLRQILITARKAILDQCGFDRVAVFLYDHNSRRIEGDWDRLEPSQTPSFQLEGADLAFWGIDRPDSPPYIFKHNYADHSIPDPSHVMVGVREHALVHLRANEELVGFISVDNQYSGRGFEESDVEQVLPIAQIAAIAIQKARLLARSQRTADRNQRLLEISARMNETGELRDLLRLVRDAIVDVGGFDRAAVFLFDHGSHQIRGTWGTNRQGKIEDISHEVYPSSESDFWFSTTEHAGQISNFIRIQKFAVDDPETKWGPLHGVVEHATVLLRANGQTVGYIAADNLLTGRPFESADLQELLPFAHQAASAIFRAHLIEQTRRSTEQKDRLMELASAINETLELRPVLRMIRDAVVESGAFDRAGLFLYDAVSNSVIGTWGTDREGNVEDISERIYPVAESDRAYYSNIPGQTLKSYLRVDTFNWTPGQEDYEYMVGVQNHVTVFLRANNETVGFIGADNLISKRPITETDVEQLLPFAQQAAAAIYRARLLDEKERFSRSQRRLMQMAAAVAGQQDLKTVFRLVCEALVETGWVDRVSLWLFEEERIYGTVAIDEKGELYDWSDQSKPVSECNLAVQKLLRNKKSVEYLDPTCNDRASANSVPQVFIALNAGGEIHGVIAADTFRTPRKITADVVEVFLPFSEQAAVAILNAKLLAAATEELNQRRIVEAELRTQTEELILARDQALEATRAKSQFLANMSHEIRTPMNGVIGMTSLLLETEISSTQQEYLQIVQNSAEALLTVINDVLDFSKIEAGKMVFDRSEFDLRQCVEEVGELMASRLRDRPVELICFVPANIPRSFFGDGGRIRQILTNLVGNAVKFTAKGEIAIEVQMIPTMSTKAFVRLEIRDTGIGIEEDRQQQIFESFTQADGSMTRRYGGTGLGLTLTRQIAELMGGTVGMTSQEGEGSDFWVELPLTIASESEKLPAPSSATKNVVLIVDRSESVRKVILEPFATWGLQVIEADSVTQALEIVSSGRIQDLGLVIIDEQTFLVGDPEHKTGEFVNRIPVGLPMIALKSIRRNVGLPDPLSRAIKTITKPIRQRELIEIYRTNFVTSEPLSLSSTDSTVESDGSICLGLKVVVAEDNAVNAIIIEKILKSLGCQVECVRNGLELLDELNRRPFDIVLMDIQMPEMDGLEATIRIRDNELATGKRIPIIALTAHAQASDRRRCLDAGMDDYLAKPISRQDLVSKLRSWSPT